MNMRFSHLFYSVSFVLMSLAASAQEVEMADVMRSNGKIYVVVAVIAIVFVGIIAYLLVQDNRIKKIEKQQE